VPHKSLKLSGRRFGCSSHPPGPVEIQTTGRVIDNSTALNTSQIKLIQIAAEAEDAL
jgi:hypothetical protein